MAYVLESSDEYSRLERQSRTAGYDFHSELSAWLRAHRASARPVRRVLDAGCGSGIVTHFLADEFPGAEVHGCDRAVDRVEQARATYGNERVVFACEDLTALSYASGSFDRIVCRYVIQHLSAEERARALGELYRVLAPGGTLLLVDVDGLFFNLHPMAPSLQSLVERAFNHPGFDLHVGRKLPTLLTERGFSSVSWEIDTMSFRGELLWAEVRLTRERLQQAQGFLASILGSEREAATLCDEYVAAMQAPGAVLFYNKFLVAGSKDTTSDSQE